MVIAQPKQVNQKGKGAFIGTHYIFIYILWRLHNHRNLSIARWSYISDEDFWTKMALFQAKGSSVAHPLTLYSTYYGSLFIHDFGSTFTSTLRAWVNMFINMVHLLHITVAS